jgi:hypothetical protein
MKYRGLAMLFLLSACTVNNPSYVGPGGGGDGSMGLPGQDGGISFHDGGGHADFAALPDLSTGCAPDTRSCISTPIEASESCLNGTFVPSRPCPSASTCMDGYCQPPPAASTGQGTPCDTNNGQPLENDCSSLSQVQPSCEPFVNPADKSVSWFCDDPVGVGLPGSPCTSGKQCRTGFCGSNGTCFRGCVTDMDCPNNGRQLVCQTVDIEVEGVKVSAQSCIP